MPQEGHRGCRRNTATGPDGAPTSKLLSYPSRLQFSSVESKQTGTGSGPGGAPTVKTDVAVQVPPWCGRGKSPREMTRGRDETTVLHHGAVTEVSHLISAGNDERQRQAASSELWRRHGAVTEVSHQQRCLINRGVSSGEQRAWAPSWCRNRGVSSTDT